MYLFERYGVYLVNFEQIQYTIRPKNLAFLFTTLSRYE